MKKQEQYISLKCVRVSPLAVEGLHVPEDVPAVLAPQDRQPPTLHHHDVAVSGGLQGGKTPPLSTGHVIELH